MAEPTDTSEHNGPDNPSSPSASDEPRKPSDRVLAIIGVLLGAFAVLQGLGVLGHRALITWILVCIAFVNAFLPWLVSRQWKYATHAYAILCSILIIVLYHYTAIANVGPSIDGLQFVRSPEVVPYCWSVTGNGVIPLNDSLLIFDSPSLNSHGDLVKPVLYSFQGAAKQIRGTPNWLVPDIHILSKSSKGDYDTLFGVVMAKGDAQAIKSIETFKAGSYWRFTQLPVGAGHIKPFVVQRNGNPGSCR